MLVRELRRLLPFLIPAGIIVWLLTRLDNSWASLPSIASLSPQDPIRESQISTGTKHTGHEVSGYTEGVYREVFSRSTLDKKYFKIDFSPHPAINPNAIPHPTLPDTWIIVAQRDEHYVENSVWFTELMCNAVFKDETLTCIHPPFIAPIGRTYAQGKCADRYGHFSFNVGPHDARVFYGPLAPYIIYGSNSQYTCFGQWIQDFRLLTDWPFEFFNEGLFTMPAEIQRPEPYGAVEKNYFVFWDKDNNIYAHYDVFPKRAFAKLGEDGSAGPDLAPAAVGDEKCINKHVGTIFSKKDVPRDNESIHQATNSILITLCKRSDPACKVEDSNTFIMTIFQHKKFYNGHSVYDPYVMLFEQRAPFAIHGLSTKPFWISGRGMPGKWKTEEGKTMDQTQMLYVTSMSWKKAGQKYHGYIDDVLFVLFGVEDAGTGGIDITAGDLLADIALCASE